MSYLNIVEYYRLLFALRQYHNYSLTELYEMYPYERDVFIYMIKDYLDKQKEENG